MRRRRIKLEASTVLHSRMTHIKVRDWSGFPYVCWTTVAYVDKPLVDVRADDVCLALQDAAIAKARKETDRRRNRPRKMTAIFMGKWPAHVADI